MYSRSGVQVTPRRIDDETRCSLDTRSTALYGRAMIFSSPLSSRHAARVGLLIDLDNLAVREGKLLPRDLVGRRLEAVARLTGHCDYRIAIAPTRTLGAYIAQLVEHRIPVRSCGPERNAADLALCAEGYSLLTHGYTALVVASGDHFFAHLADLAPLFVAVPPGIPVARALLKVATPIHPTSAVIAA
jgi:hypothetical protein